MSLFSALVGPIQKTEETSVANINCDPQVQPLQQASIIDLSYSVILPLNAGKLVPLAGGTLVKVTNGNSAFNVGKDSTGNYSQYYVSKINEFINIVISNLTLSELEAPAAYLNYAQVNYIKREINKTFISLSKVIQKNVDTNSIYINENIPEVIFSTIRRPISANNTTADVYKASLKSDRDQGLLPFGFFTFIPIEILNKIIEIVAEKAPNFIANTGLKFSELKTIAAQPSLTDLELAKIIEEFIPYYNIAEQAIISEENDNIQLIGYYTFYNSNFYFRLPDLSGNGPSETGGSYIYSGGEESPQKTLFIFEFLLKKEGTYAALPIEPVVLPALSIISSEIEYSFDGASDVIKEIVVEPENILSGYVGEKSSLSDSAIKFYLSPIDTSYLTQLSLKKNNGSLFGVKTSVANSTEICTIPVEFNAADFETNGDPEIFADEVAKYGTIYLGSNPIYSIANKIKSLDTIFGLLSRSRILLSSRDSVDSTSANEKKEDILFSTEQKGTREALAGNLSANINRYWASDKYKASATIPKLWLECDHSYIPDQNIVKITVKKYHSLYSDSDEAGKININNVQFALYMIDSLGQFYRVPGPNIKISSVTSSLDSVTPNGMIGGPVINPDDSIALRFEGENLKYVTDYYIRGVTRDIKLSEGMTIINFGSTSILYGSKKWSDFTSSVGKLEIYAKTARTRNTFTNSVKVFLSSELVISTDNDDKVKFNSLCDIYSNSEKEPVSADIQLTGPDSIPLILGGPAYPKIYLKSKSRGLLKEKNYGKIFAYIAFESKEIVETFGLKSDVTSFAASQKTIYFNKKIKWTFGQEGFRKDSGFFGGLYLELIPPNIVAQHDLTEALKSQKAYIVFTNAEVINTIDIGKEFDYNLTVLTLGKDDLDKKAFIMAPHIYGAMLETKEESEGYADFDIAKIYNSTDALSKNIKSSIPAGMLSSEKISAISTANSLVSGPKIKYLYLIFAAPSRSSAQLSRSYEFYIGNKNITRYRIGKISYIGENLAAVAFKNIDSAIISGTSPILVRHTGREYPGYYDGTLYNKVSKRIAADNFKKTSDQIEILNSENSLINKTKNYFDYLDIIEPQVKYNKLHPFGYSIMNSTDTGSSNSGILSNISYYLKFANSVYFYSSEDITIGKIENINFTNIKVGVVTTDLRKAADGSLAENIVTISGSSTKVVVSLAEIKELAQKQKEAAAAAVSAKIAENNKLKESGDLTEEQSTGLDQSETGIANYEKLQSEMDELLADVNATVDQINAKIAQINAALAIAAAFSDQLSSLVSGAIQNVLDSLSSDKSQNITVVNLESVKFSDTFSASDSSILFDETELFISTTFGTINAHSIRLRVPKIISIEYNNKVYREDEFSKVKFLGNAKILVRVLDGTLDSKIEISKIRFPSILKARDGNIYTYEVTLNESKLLRNFAPDGNNCYSLTITNDNEPRLNVNRVIEPAFGQDAERFFDRSKNKLDRFGKQSKKKIDERIERAKLKFGPNIYDKALTVKEAMTSFCDFSFHLTAEIAFQLRSLKILFIPIKVIFCIIDVLCALTNPVKLALAIIRLFGCLFDLLLLLPQLSLPILFLTILIHLLELLLCVVQKTITIIVATNEIIQALDRAARERDYDAIKNLEETLSEHLITIEADLQVMEPILQIIALIQELLQLVFAFPCQVNQDPDDPGCIDPSMLAGLIVGKVAPAGFLVPDAMLPMAQTYTQLPIARVGENGNTPDGDSKDPEEILDIDYNSPPKGLDGATIRNVLRKVEEAVASGADTIVQDNTLYADGKLPGLIDSETGEPKVTSIGGYFYGDRNSDGYIDNIDYQKLRFKNGDFNASFTLSCTKSKKKFSFGIPFLNEKNDPRFVEFQFSSRGLTNDLAFNRILQIFFKKKIIDENFPLDSSPTFLKAEDTAIKIATQNSSGIRPQNVKLISPIDGFSDFLEYVGVNGDVHSFKPRPLVANVEISEPGVDGDGNPEVQTRTVTKTFGGIPSFAIVDDRFNVYFVEDGGFNIKLNPVQRDSGGTVYVPVIDTIFAKMINYPAASTQKFDKEEQQTVRSTNAYAKGNKLIRSDIVDELLVYCGGKDSIESRTTGYGHNLGMAILKMQENALFFQGLTAKQYLALQDAGEAWIDSDNDLSLFGSSSPIFVEKESGSVFINNKSMNAALYNNGSIGSDENYLSKNGAQKLADYINALYDSAGKPNLKISDPPNPEYGVYDFANGTIIENDDFQYSISDIDVFTFPQIYLVDLRQVADEIAAACSTSQVNQLLLDQPGFQLDFNGDVVDPLKGCFELFLGFYTGENGVIEKIKKSLNAGEIPKQTSIADVKKNYDDFVLCINDAVDRTCKFVVNPLNTSFKLLGDKDNTPLDGYIDPSNSITDIIQDGAIENMPRITGAMEYASGIGDSITIPAGTRGIIQIIPRDSYDDEIFDTIDLTRKINIEIVSDETSGARIEKISAAGDTIISKQGNIYTAAITSNGIGKVTIKASICDTYIQAVTERGLKVSNVDDGCIPDKTEVGLPEVFAPGSIIKVDRILTVLFVKNNVNKFDQSGVGEVAITNPQVPFTIGE